MWLPISRSFLSEYTQTLHLRNSYRRAIVRKDSWEIVWMENDFTPSISELHKEMILYVQCNKPACGSRSWISCVSHTANSNSSSMSPSKSGFLHWCLEHALRPSDVINLWNYATEVSRWVDQLLQYSLLVKIHLEKPKSSPASSAISSDKSDNQLCRSLFLRFFKTPRQAQCVELRCISLINLCDDSLGE